MIGTQITQVTRHAYSVASHPYCSRLAPDAAGLIGKGSNMQRGFVLIVDRIGISRKRLEEHGNDSVKALPPFVGGIGVGA